MTRMRLKLAATFILSALLAAGGTARAQRVEGETLTPDERREAGEFLLRLDERWRAARDFSAVFDEMFVGDYLEASRGKFDAFPLVFVEESLRGQLSAADLRRAHVAGLDLAYVAGRLVLAFEQREKRGKAAAGLASAASPRPPADGGESPPGREEGDDSEPSLEEMLSPAVAEVFRSNPLLASAILEEGKGEQAGGGEPSEIRTHGEFDELLSAIERAMPKLRERASELEAGLPGAPLSAVAPEDEGEGESPDLSLTVLGDEWRNRPAGTRVICGYVSHLHVDLVLEGGRYKVLAAYVED